MSATPEIKLADLLCIHGQPLNVPCLECDEFMREFYPECVPSESETIQ